MPKTGPKKEVVTLKHDEASRKNIPTAEFQSVMQPEELNPIAVTYERKGKGLDREKEQRNRDLDPQLVWRGKDQQDWSDLVVQAPPLYIQEKIHPKVLIHDLLRRTASDQQAANDQYGLFADFNGLPSEAARTEFYQHDANWTNRMILGDSLQVMASLAEREGLRGKVQCIYIDPPSGIKINSNFQWSTTTNKVADGKAEHITREPEQVKAFRDTWRDGIHSYLTYLRDRITVCRDLLSDTGSVFVQIGKDNLHRILALLEEIFGTANLVSVITFVKTSSQTDNLLAPVADYILWFAKGKSRVKFRALSKPKALWREGGSAYNLLRSAYGPDRRLTASEKNGIDPLPDGSRVFRIDNLTSQSPGTRYEVVWKGRKYFPKGYWKTQEFSMTRLVRAQRVEATDNGLYYVRFFDDFPFSR